MASTSHYAVRVRFVPAGSLRALGAAVAASVVTTVALAAQPSEGEQVFKSACVACHGEDGRGGPGGGAPLENVTDVALIVAMATDGRGNMPPLGDALTAEQIRAVAAYVVNDLFKRQTQ